MRRRRRQRRELYYLEADRRYHLFGATEGWLEVGHLAAPRRDLEIRWFDRDHDGYLDTRELFLPDRARAGTRRAFSPRARRVTLDREALTKEYYTRVLPEAIADNQRIIAALKKVASSPARPEEYEALASGEHEHPERKRYMLDIARELHFLAVRDALYARAAAGPYPATARRSQQVAQRRPRLEGSPGCLDGR